MPVNGGRGKGPRRRSRRKRRQSASGSEAIAAQTEAASVSGSRRDGTIATSNPDGEGGSRRGARRLLAGGAPPCPGETRRTEDGPSGRETQSHRHDVPEKPAAYTDALPCARSGGGAASGTANAQQDEAAPRGNRKRGGRKRHRPNRAERRASETGRAPVSDQRGGFAADETRGRRAPGAGSPGGAATGSGMQGEPGRRAAGPRGSAQGSGHGALSPRGRAGGAERPAFRREDEALPEHRRLYAALDLGTNNCRLLVARPEQRGFRVVDAFSRIVRLGEGLGHTNRLCESAMDRALEALACCRDKLLDRGVERARLIATEACRAAENGPLFIERVRQETGLSLEIATRETEARLAVAGCASLVDPDANGVVLFDIGGGSSEIVWLDLRNRCGARGVALTRFIRAWISLPVGVVNLAERHGGRNVSPDDFEAMVEDARHHLEDFSLGEELSAAICDGRVHMLGTSGTVTTLAGVHFGLKRYDRRRVDGAWMDSEDVSAMIERLRSMPYEERCDNPCIGADRADLVLAGCAILEAIRRRWPCQRLRVADRGLREGMLMELMAADNVWRRSSGARHRARGRKDR
ncbi:Ppx/GppA phosphatase family protein [Stappia sp. ICDLI1TA098]